MNDAEIYRASPPAETIVAVPQPQTLEYVYDRDAEGNDVFGVMFVDKRLGPMFIALDATMATHVTAHLSSMLQRRRELRSIHQERNTP